MEEKQTNYTIGECVELPSKGLVYDTPVKAQVELRSMTARDEMKRCNPSSSNFKTIADIIEGCMIEKPAIHVYDMALGDYEYLLVKLRVISYGDEYSIDLTCPYCGKPIDAVAHLDDLEVKQLDETKFRDAQSITLPASKKVVTLKMQTPRMLDEIDAKSKEMKRKFKTAEVDFDTLIMLETVIDTVDGEKLAGAKMETFINTLPAKDLLKILNSIDTLNSMIGIINKLPVDCDKCGGEVEAHFRYGQEFFRPANI